MNFRAEIDVMPLKELLDPQGKAVAHGLQKMGYAQVADVRVGKHITLKLTAESEQDAQAKVEEACKKLLANPIMEGYTFQVYAD